MSEYCGQRYLSALHQGASAGDEALLIDTSDRRYTDLAPLGAMDKESSEPGRPLRALRASVVTALLVYGSSELLLRALPRHSPVEAIDLLSSTIGLGCLFMQLVALILPCAALVLLALTAVHTWRSHLAIVPIAALVLAGALFSVGRWLCGLYGLDPPYFPFFLGAAMQLVAVSTPLAAFGWVIVRVVRRFSTLPDR